MSYAKAMKHYRNPKKWKMTPARRRGNWLVFGKPTTAMTEKELKASGALNILGEHAKPICAQCVNTMARLNQFTLASNLNSFTTACAITKCRFVVGRLSNVILRM